MSSPQAETSPSRPPPYYDTSPVPAPYYDWSPPWLRYYDPSVSRPPAIVLAVGIVLVGLFMLFIVGICAFYYKRRNRRRMRGPGLDNDSSSPSQPPEAEQNGGPPQHRQPNITPPMNVPTTAGRGLGSVRPQPPPSPSQPLNADQNGGPPQHQQPNITPPMNVPTTAGRGLGSVRPQPPPSPGIAFGQSLMTFSYDDLATATDGFSNLNLLGLGGFGSVHKGVLRNGKTVAIKQLRSGSEQGDPEFEAEVKIIGRVHHRHLVSLVGYCKDETHQMLVYDYVPNNTLDFHLHGNDRQTLDWPTRMKIAIGCAKGLAYLHEDCQPKIIHRDIKGSNILLDDSFEAKLADFGLAKFFPHSVTHISTIAVKGTPGYLAPEYADSGRFTHKIDVFSFGVVLVELITGKKPRSKTQSFPDGNMLNWARPLLSQALKNGNFDPLVDPRLQNNYIPDEMKRMATCAAICVHPTATFRPPMGQVVRALEGNLALEELFAGATPGPSGAFSLFEGSGYDIVQNNEDLEKLRKLALEGQEHSTTSEYLTLSSELGQHPSTSSGGGQQNTRDGNEECQE